MKSTCLLISSCNRTESNTITEEIQTSKFKAKKSNEPVGEFYFYFEFTNLNLFGNCMRSRCDYKLIIPLKFPNTFQILYFAFMTVDSMFDFSSKWLDTGLWERNLIKEERQCWHVHELVLLARVTTMLEPTQYTSC